MKGKLSRMWRSGLSMMLALIMMFSLGTVAFATEGSVDDALALAEQLEEASANVTKAWNTLQAAGDKLEAIGNSEDTNVYVAALAKLSVALGEALVSQDSVQELKTETSDLKDDVDALLVEIEEVQAELDAAQADLDAAKAKLEQVQADAKALQDDINNATFDIETEIDLDIEIDMDFDLTTMTPAEIQAKAEEIKAQVEKLDELKALKAELEAKEEAEAQAMLEKAEALEAAVEDAKADVEAAQDRLEALEARADALEAEANSISERATALAAEYVAFAKGVAGEVAGDVTEIVKNLAAVLGEHVDAETLVKAAKFVYGSAEEQGYIALVVEALEEAKLTLANVKEEAAYVSANLSPELKAELAEALDSAEATLANLIDAAKAAKNLDTEATKAELKAAADVAYAELTSVKEILVAATAEDAALLRTSLLKGIDAAIDAAFMLGDLMLSAIEDATTETITVPCADYNIVALGDSSMEGYAALVAAELGANLDVQLDKEEAYSNLNINNEAIVNADMVLMGFGFDGMTNYVGEKLRSMEGDFDWSTIVEDTTYVERALDKIKDELIAAGLSNDVVNTTLIALESYAYSYAKYLVSYPLVVNDIHNVNSDALVVVVGLYNPLDGVILNADKVSVDLGLFMDVLVEATGAYNLASAILLPNTIYVEAKDVATSMPAGEINAYNLANTLVNKANLLLPTAEGAEYIKGQIMNALTVVQGAHVAAPAEAVAPTCTETGLTEGTVCAVCGAVLEAQEVVPALGHDWDEGVISGDDKYLKSLITYTCKRCGETLTEAYDKMHYMFFAGYPDGSFGTERNISREEVAVVFYAMLNEKYQVADADFVYAGTYSDVAEGQWYTKAVEVLSDLGVIAGYPDGTFGVEKSITRAEFATMAVALAQFEVDGTEIFPDVEETDWFYDYVRTAVNNNCVAGYPDGTFQPNASITRAEAAVIACNMAGRPYECAKEYFDYYSAADGLIPTAIELGTDDAPVVTTWDEIKVLSDVAGHWAYYWLVEATNTHYHVVGLD